MLDDGRVRARLRAWPNERSVAQLVLTDHTKAPSITTLEEWMRIIGEHGFSRVRTGALAASAVSPFVELGFEPIQTLALLRLDLDRQLKFGVLHRGCSDSVTDPLGKIGVAFQTGHGLRSETSMGHGRQHRAPW